MRSAAPKLRHLSFGVSDIEVSARFHDAVLGALGHARVWSDMRPGEADQAVGYGPPGPGFHLAFAAPSRAAVHALHDAALRHGGLDNGAAGLRPDYGPQYYAAFVIEPDGHRIEAVINQPD